MFLLNITINYVGFAHLVKNNFIYYLLLIIMFKLNF